MTIPYPIGGTDCFSISDGQLYVADPNCYSNCTLVRTCPTPPSQITCITPPETCTEGDLELRNGFTVEYPTGYRAASGRVEVCVNGEYVDVCQGSITAQAICTDMQYAGIVEQNGGYITHTQTVAVSASSHFRPTICILRM